VAEGPGKVFVGGLPYHLTEDEIKELLSAFGPLRSFHLVKDTGTIFVLHEILTKVYVIINALCIYLIRCVEFKGIRIL
jgi:RNA recognition motif-containing protein